MFIDVVPNGRSAPAVLLRESWREGKRVRKRTIANLGALPPAMIDGLRVLLAGGGVVAKPEEVFEIQRALPHGHVAAVVGMMRKLDLPRLLGRPRRHAVVGFAQWTFDLTGPELRRENATDELGPP